MSITLKSTNLTTITSLIDPSNLIVSNEYQLNENGEKLYNEKNKIVNPTLQYQHGKTWKQITNVSWMIENEYFEMLIEKVKKSEYLCFSNKVQEYPSSKKEESLLTKYKYSIFDCNFKQLLENPTFYNNLYKNYSNYYLSSLETTAKVILPYDNVVALDVLIKNFGYVPSSSYLTSAIKNAKFSIANYLYENHKSVSFDYCQFFVNGQIKSSIFSSPNTSSSSDSNMMVPIFTGFRYLFKGTVSTLFEICNWISRFSGKLQPFIEYMNKLSNDGDKVVIGELNAEVANLLSYWKYLNGSGDNFNVLSIEELDAMKFTTDELNQTIESFSVGDKRVESLIKMVLPFNGLYGYGESFTFYQYKYKTITMDESLVNKDINPYEFGILDHDDYKCRSITDKGTLFKCIPNESSRQLQFLNDTIKELIENESNYPVDKKLNSDNLIRMVCDFGNLEYFELVRSKLFNSKLLPSDIIMSINSNSILDNVLQFITIDFIKRNTKFNFIRKLIVNNQLELLANLKNNHTELYNQFYQNLTFDDDIENTEYSADRSVSFQSFKYLYENYNEFKSCYFNGMKRWPINNLTGLDQLDYIIFKTPLINLDIQNFQFFQGMGNHDNLLDWVMQFNEMVSSSTNNTNQKKFDLGYKKVNIELSYKLLKCPIKELLATQSPNATFPNCVSQNFTIGIKRYSDLESLDFIMSNYFSTVDSNPNEHYRLSSFITTAILDGDLNILKFISKNYPWVFKFDPTTLEIFGCKTSDYVKYAVNANNIEVLLFLAQELQFPVKNIKSLLFKENNDLLSSFYKLNKIMF